MSNAEKEYLSLNERRRSIYAFLSRVYEKEITPNILKEMVDKVQPLLSITDLPELARTDLAKGTKELARFVKDIEKQDPKSLEVKLAADYARLFLGIHGVPSHPSESVYLIAGDMIMQAPRDEVLKTYLSVGVGKKKEFTEPEDHIAAELGFMAHLCEKAGEAKTNRDMQQGRKYLQMQQEFLDDHLLRWVPQLAKDIISSSRLDFYKAIARITKAYIELDRATIEDYLRST